ncbi:MAG: peptidoglycan D,D-transpeptidase FtsI family protein [Gammaproteobacteria bacterium]
MNREEKSVFRLRRWFVLSLFTLSALGLTGRAAFLQVVQSDFLQEEGTARQQRVMSVPAYRGMITDRNGEPLAISTPMDSVWANPGELPATRDNLTRIARAVQVDADWLRQRLAKRAEREFVYLRRHVTPAQANKVMALGVPGINLLREYRRYYPLGEAAGHAVGLTNIDDRGQEGLELAYDDWLAGVPGAKRVIKDRLGRTVEDVELIRPPRPGKNLVLSLDRRIQYLAYRELKKAVKDHNARAGSIVALDPHSGEVIAMVNQPLFNPNNRRKLRGGSFRNRAVTDVFEPGSTIKPLAIAAALETGRFRPDTPVDTSPGYVMVRGHTIKDVRNYGLIDVATVVSKSSNVGASKLALDLPPENIWRVYKGAGLGTISGSGFPGEAAGLLADHARWRELDRATLAFGYSLSVTPLQLAQAYAVLAADGMKPALTHLHTGRPGKPTRVISADTARQVRAMLERAVGTEGTGQLAAFENYRVAGKTGTVHKSTVGGYAEDRYISLFAGMAPVSNPRLVVVVMIDEPRGERYFGGQIAAPVFARVMAGAMRILNVPPDGLRPVHVASTGEVGGG